jgi:uncharacterized damage-inducible protein DinB
VHSGVDVSALIERYQEGISALSDAVEGLSAEDLNLRLAPGKWSIRQIVAHLLDAELVYLHRIRKVIAEHGGLLTSFSQDAWVEAFSTDTVPLEVSVNLFTALRTYHTALFQSLSPDVFLRTGTHEEAGSMTAFALLEKVTDHLYHHVSQIETIRQMYL